MAKGNSSSVPHTRRVAVALIISTSSLSDEPSFLLVPSRKHTGKFVFPKGGVEEGESAAVAGERESWEEGELSILTSSFGSGVATGSVLPGRC